MSSVLNYIEKKQQETQRLVGLKSEQLEQQIGASERFTYREAKGK